MHVQGWIIIFVQSKNHFKTVFRWVCESEWARVHKICFVIILWICQRHFVQARVTVKYQHSQSCAISNGIKGQYWHTTQNEFCVASQIYHRLNLSSNFFLLCLLKLSQIFHFIYGNLENFLSQTNKLSTEFLLNMQ